MRIRKKIPELSIIVPLYNEERRFPRSFKIIDSYFSKLKMRKEYILVDDGSKDRTFEIAKSLKGKDPIRVLQNPFNQGKGVALKLGVLNSLGKIIFFTDADLSTPIEEFGQLFPYLKSYDLVIGSRRLSNSQVKIRQPFHRRFLGGIFYILFSVFFTTSIKDANCGFKLYRGKVARRLFNKQANSRWGFDAEILFLAEKFGYRIKEVPVIWLNDPYSKVSSLQASVYTVWELMKIKLNSLRGKYD